MQVPVKPYAPSGTYNDYNPGNGLLSQVPTSHIDSKVPGQVGIGTYLGTVGLLT